MAEQRQDWEARFWSKVDKTSGCWIWKDQLDAEGYGRLYLNRLAHTLAWELSHGSIPDGMKICHSCDVRSCVRIDHLFIGTQKDNMNDAALKCRMAHKLDLQDVQLVRELASKGVSRKAILKQFPNVSYWTICDILNGRSRSCLG